MKNDIYFQRLCDITGNTIKLYSYLHVLKAYTENETPNSQIVGNIDEILDLAVKEIDEIIDKT